MANRILTQNSNRIVTQNGLYYIDYNLSPISAGTECFICEICDDISTKIVPPHPVWTNNYGRDVILLDAIVLGGMNGLNN